MPFLLMLAMAANAVVIRPVANMYSGPSEEKDVVSQAIYGTNLAVLENSGGWAKVRTPDDYTGWMPDASFLSGAAMRTRDGSRESAICSRISIKRPASPNISRC